MSEEKKPVNVAKKEQDVSALVLKKIQSYTGTGEIQMPPNYSPENALKGAWIILQEQKGRDGKLVVETCTNQSIAQALFKMCMEGLSAIKGQGYFIPYGDQLTWVRDYNGSRALAKRVAGVEDVPANVVFEGDDFQYGVDPDTGYQYLIKHIPSPDNRDMSKIKGAYAIVIYSNGKKNLEYMTMEEIRQAWNQGATKGQSPAHKNFPQEMAKKTVINRACKSPINSSDDGYLYSSVEEIHTEDIAHEVVDEVEQETGTKQIEFETEDDTPY